MAITGITSKIRSYRRTFGWLAVDAWRSAPGQVSSLGLLNFISVAARLGAIGVVLAFAHAQSESDSQSFLGMEIEASTSLSSVLAWSAAALGLAILAACLTYWLERTAFKIAQHYSKRATGFVLSAFESGGGPQVPNLPLYQEEDYVRRLLSRDMTMVSRSLLVVLRSAAPAITFLFSIAWLFYVHVGLTLIALALLAFYAVPLFLVNTRVVQASRDREKHTTTIGAGVKRFLPMLMNRSGASDARRNWNDVFHETLPVEENFAALKDILLARKRVTFLQDLYFGLALVLALVIFSVMIAENPGSWVVFISYLVALRFASASMKTIASFVTSTNRYLPQVARYVDFVRGSRRRTVEVTIDDPPLIETAPTVNGSAPQTAPLKNVRLRCTDPQIAGSSRELVIEPGQSALVMDLVPLYVGTLRRWCRRLCASSTEGDRLWNNAFFLGDVSRLPGLPVGLIVAHNMAEAERQKSRIEAVLDQFDLYDEYRQWPDGLATVLDAGREHRLSKRMRFVLAMMEGILTERPVFIVNYKNLTAQSGSFHRPMQIVLANRVMLLAAEEIVDELPESVNTIAAVEERIIGLGDASWYKSASGQLQQRWQTALRGRATVMQDLEDDALMDEDDDE